MNRHTVVEIETAQLVGRNAHRVTIIDAFPVGFSATGKTIVEIIVTNLTQNIVQSVTKLETLNARTVAASRCDGDAILRTIVEMEPMRNIRCARICIEIAQRASSSAVIRNAFLHGGVAMEMKVSIDSGL